MRTHRLALLALALSAAATAAACTLEGDEAGCRGDDECPDGTTCRAGACFRYTTDAGPPRDPAEAGAETGGPDGGGD